MDRRTVLAALLALPFSLRIAIAGCEVKGTRPSGLRSVVIPPDTKKLFVVGDFGTGGSLQKKVARAMNSLAATHGKPLAMISTGDNIYPKGVTSADDPQWKTKFEQIYALDHLADLTWLAVLGNHDHRGSIQAQMEYSKINPHWVMPSTYYVRPCPQAEKLITLFCLDTQAILQKTDGWRDQLTWLREQLASCTTPWKLAVGHHPIRSYGYYQDEDWMLKDVKPILDAGGVAAYLCGHDHDLQIIRNQADGFACIVSGGGGGCRTTSWGPNSLATFTGGGFVAVSFTDTELYAQIVDGSGAAQGTALLASRKERTHGR